MRIKQIAVMVLLQICLAPVWAAQALVDAGWLVSNIKNPEVVVLDLQPQKIYNQYHVPGAINSNYAHWRRPDAKGVPQMMPPVAALEQLIGGLGIDNNSHVVLVVTGRGVGEMASATRVYWTFKALGHEKVSILNGGLIAYANNRSNPMENRANRPQQRKFKAKLNPEFLLSSSKVKSSMDKGVTIVDSRSVAEHLGLIGGGGKERPGTIPGSISLPYDWLTINGSASFHSPENLKRIYQTQGVPLDKEQISYCHTGHRTSLSWFVSHEILGNKKARMYDGSTAEWSIDRALPIEVKIKLQCPPSGAC